MQSQEISLTPISGNPIAEIKSIHHDFAFFPHFHEFHSGNLFVNHVHSMRVISHEIEDRLSQAQSTGELFAGFQKLSHFLPHVKRYRALAKKGIKIWIFGIPDITPPNIDDLQYIYLTEKHALSNEWFVIANATDFFSALIAEELTDASPFSRPVAKKETLFRGYWTFDQTQIEDLLLQIKIELGFEDRIITNAAERNYERQITALFLSANNLVHQLEKRKEDLIRQQKMYEDLVGMLVHDLRGALTGVIGPLDLLVTGRVQNEDERQSLIINSLNDSERLARMISNLLDINKLESGLFTPNRELVDLNDMLQTILTRWSTIVHREDHQFKVDIPEILPVVIGDRELLERIFDNLLSNALKYGQVIKLAVRWKNTGIIVSIEDDGPGIPMSDREYVFEKYARANLGNAQRKGTGLGLPFCKLAIEALGGRISIEDSPSGGASFQIVLPVKPPSLIKPSRRHRTLRIDSSQTKENQL
jgi:signal transduction histidine kinase